MEKLTIFQKMALCVNEVKRGSNIEVECKLGLWSIEGPKESVYAESLHYWKQYADDGEYSCKYNGSNISSHERTSAY